VYLNLESLDFVEIQSSLGYRKKNSRQRSEAKQQAAESPLRFYSSGFAYYDFLALPFSVAILLYGGIEKQENVSFKKILTSEEQSTIQFT